MSSALILPPACPLCSATFPLNPPVKLPPNKMLIKVYQNFQYLVIKYRSHKVALGKLKQFQVLSSFHAWSSWTRIWKIMSYEKGDGGTGTVIKSDWVRLTNTYFFSCLFPCTLVYFFSLWFGRNSLATNTYSVGKNQ